MKAVVITAIHLNANVLRTIIIFLLIFGLAACSVTPFGQVQIPETGNGAPKVVNDLDRPDRPVKTSVPFGGPQQTPVTLEPEVQTPGNPVVEATSQARNSSDDQPAGESPFRGFPAKINASNVSLRVGPGLNYEILRLMPKGLDVDVMGRSLDGAWLEVHLLDGTGGWAFAEYIDLPSAMINLPVSTAFGGPFKEKESAKPEIRLDLTVNIVGDRAVLEVANFPAGAALLVELGLPGQGADLVVAQGQTNDIGSAEIEFHMPVKWSNGQAVRQDRLQLMVRTLDGSFSRTIQVQYQRD